MLTEEQIKERIRFCQFQARKYLNACALHASIDSIDFDSTDTRLKAAVRQARKWQALIEAYRDVLEPDSEIDLLMHTEDWRNRYV